MLLVLHKCLAMLDVNIWRSKFLTPFVYMYEY